MKSRLKANIVYNFAYQLLILLLPLVTAPYLARVIGAEGVGIYSYSYSVATYFVYIAMLGLNNYGNRKIASCCDNAEERSKTFWSIFFMQSICFLLCGLLYIIYVCVFSADALVALLQGPYVLSALFDINWFFFGMEKFKLTVIRNTIVKTITTVLIFVFVKQAADINMYILIMSTGFLVSQFCLWPFLPRFVRYIKPSFLEVVGHFRPNLILFIPVIAVSIYNILSKIILGFEVGYDSVGYFENAVKIIAVPIALISAIGTVMLPRTSALLAEERHAESLAYLSKTMRYVMVFSGIASFGILSVAMPFTNIFYGPGFSLTSDVISILVFTIPLLGFGNVIRTQYLIPAARDNILLWSAVCGAVINVVINLLLIPVCGAIGAAFASLGAELAVLTYQLLGIRKQVNLKPFFKIASVCCLGGLLMFCVLRMMPSVNSDVVDVIVKVSVGIVIYSVFFGSFRCLSKKAVKLKGSDPS